MKYVLSLIIIIAVAIGINASERSDELYTTAMTLFKANNETEARELLTQCLDIEAADSLSHSYRNVRHWLHYLDARRLQYDTDDDGTMDFTPVDRHTIADSYIRPLDRVDALLRQGKTVAANATLDSAYTAAETAGTLPRGYMIDLLLRLFNLQQRERFVDTAKPRLSRWVDDSIDDTEHGYNLVNALYNAYGDRLFDHISPKQLANVGSDRIFKLILQGNSKAAIDVYGGFSGLTAHIFGENSLEMLPMLENEDILIRFATPDAAHPGLFRMLYERRDSILDTAIQAELDPDQSLYLAKELLRLARTRAKDCQDTGDSITVAYTRRAEKYISDRHLDRDDRILLARAELIEDTDREKAKKYAEEALNIALKKKAGKERIRAAANILKNYAWKDLDIDNALRYTLAGVDPAEADAMKYDFYLRTSVILQTKGQPKLLVQSVRALVDSARAVYGENSDQYRQSLAALINILNSSGLVSEARSTLYQLDQACSDTGVSIYKYIDRYSTERIIYETLGLPFDGFERLRSDLPEIEKTCGKYTPELSNLLHRYAAECNERNLHDEAIATLQRVMMLDSVSHGVLYDPIPDRALLACYKFDSNPADSIAPALVVTLQAYSDLYEGNTSIAALFAIKDLQWLRRKYALVTSDFATAYAAAERRRRLEYPSEDSYLYSTGDMLNISSHMGNNDLAYTLVPEYYALFREKILPRLVLMSDEERNSYWPGKAEWSSRLMLRPLFTGGGDRFAPYAYDNVLLNKGLLLQGTRAIEQALEGVPELRSELTEVIERQKMSNDPDESHRLYQREKEILSSIAGQTIWGDIINLTHSNVAAALPDSAIAVEFCTFTLKGHTRYGALCVDKDAEPRFIDLFDLRSLTADNTDPYAVLSDSVWAPLLKAYPDTRTIYFSPDGELCRQPLEVAKAPGTDMSMADSYTLHRLSSTRQLALARSESHHGHGVAMGGLKYDSSPTPAAAGSKTSHRSALRDYFGATQPLPYLPGTEHEARSVSDIAHHAKMKMDLFTGSKGTETQFKALSGTDVSLIHIATHGFYWTEEEVQYMPKFDYLFTDLKTTEDRSLTRSGLMMAGSNDAYLGMDIPEDAEDGILTAREIADLDLAATDFVVLSACQTALGDISGEGVFGLQRGFKKAGVQSLMLSLWKVDDEATSLLMDTFYTAYFGGRDKSEALRLARAAVRDHTAPDGSHPYADPHFWGAFILLDAI